MNGLPDERIGNLIIGEKNHIEAISFQGLKDFYEKNYLSENMVVSVVSSLPLEEVKEIIEKNFNRAKRGKISKYSLERNINCGIFSKKIEGNTGAKICCLFDINDLSIEEVTLLKVFNLWFGEGVSSVLYDEIRTKNGLAGAKICCLFDINDLSIEEVTLLKVFNLWFGEGVSSVLYDEIRTKNGLAYEVYSEVKYEKGIRLFKIYLGTSKEKEEEALGLIEKCILKAMNIEDYLSEEGLNKLIKRFKLKNSLDLEKSIVLANRMAIYETMFNRGEYIFEELNLVENLSLKDMKNLIKRVLKKSIVQIIN